MARRVAPPPKLTVSEWAELYRYLSPEASSEHGKWHNDRVPFLIEVMDAINDPLVERVVLKASSQVGKTEVLLNILGYFIDYDPAPILLIEPVKEMAETVSKDRVSPMIRDTPVLAAKVSEEKSRDKSNTILHKAFPGGRLTLIGTNSPTNLASRPIRVVLADEVDRYPLSTKTEGDPLSLAWKRTKQFWNRKLVAVSSPTDEGTSRIQELFEEGTEEYFHVPCPSCGDLQRFEWGRLDFETLSMPCTKCGSIHSELEWKSNVHKGKWIAEHPERLAETKTRSFFIFEMYSLFGTWADMKKEFMEAKRGGPEKQKTVINTMLGELWIVGGDNKIEDEVFETRRIQYGCDVPKGVQVLTAGVDVQDTRLEIDIVGWGSGRRSWGIQFAQLIGSPGGTDVWEQLDRLRNQTWQTEDGRLLRISCTCIDSGGHFTQDVYEYCRIREDQRVFAIKGVGGAGHPIVGKYNRVGRHKTALFPVGADAGKMNIHASIRVEHPDEAAYCLWPRDEYLSDGSTMRGYDADYFRGLLAERLVLKKRAGRPVHVWEVVPGRRNEPLDCRNYAQAALIILNPKLEAAPAANASPKPEQKAEKKLPARGRRIISRGVSV